MKARRLSLLLALLALLPARVGLAGERLDLSGILVPAFEVGDYRVFVEAGGAWVREEILAVEPTVDGWRIESRFSDEDGACMEVSREVVPGGELSATKMRLDSNECPWFAAELAGRTRRFVLDAPARRTSRFKRRWHLPLGIWMYRHTLRGTQRPAEFAALETPYASHPQATRIRTRTRLSKAFFDFGFEFSNPGYRPVGAEKRRTQTWFVEGVGLVGEQSEFRDVRKRRVREVARYEIWLQEGVIGGIPYP